jgi:hypothetical protein
MQIRFSERQVGDDLAEFLRRSDCLVERIGERVLEINPRLPLLPEAARLEIEGLLRVWCRLHPEAGNAVVLLGGKQPDGPHLLASEAEAVGAGRESRARAARGELRLASVASARSCGEEQSRSSLPGARIHDPVAHGTPGPGSTGTNERRSCLRCVLRAHGNPMKPSSFVFAALLAGALALLRQRLSGHRSRSGDSSSPG